MSAERARKLRAENLKLFGGVCQDCGRKEGNDRKNKLEFHHIQPTGLKGRGRGSENRALDVKRNPDAYNLLCRECHENRHGYNAQRIREEKLTESLAQDAYETAVAEREYSLGRELTSEEEREMRSEFFNYDED